MSRKRTIYGGSGRRLTVRWGALPIALLVVAAACGGDDGEADTSPAVSLTTDAGTADSAATADENNADSDGEISVQVQEVNFPPGIVISQADNQTASLASSAYLVTARADGMRLVAITSVGAFDTDALIVGGRSAEVFNTGSRIAMTGTDENGNLVVLSSEDGETFTEAQIPVPQRYVDADVWEATSLAGDALGVADLDGELYVIARVGIDWPSDLEVAARSAYSISQEAGDAARSAGSIIQKPQGDGDILYTFKVDGEVVYETLGSAAGVESGYREAFQQALAGDTGFTGGWIISGSTATQTTSAPLGGGLDEDLRLNSLYSVGEGVAALVKDFSPEALAPQDSPTDGQTLLISARPRDSAFAFSDTGVSLSVSHSWDGEVWELAGDPIGDENGLEAEVVTDAESDTFAMVFRQGLNLSVLISDDGLDWEAPTSTLSLSLPDGGQVQVESANGRLFLILPEGSDGDSNVFEMIPDEATGEDVVDMDLVPVQLDPDPPTFEWLDDEPDPFDSDDSSFVGKTLEWVLVRGIGSEDIEGFASAVWIADLIDRIDRPPAPDGE